MRVYRIYREANANSPLVNALLEESSKMEELFSL